MASPKRILVAGGGLGGLAAAVALRQAGMEVTVCERAGELREVGSGLSVWPNATGALEALGLLGATLPRGARLHSVEVRSARNRVLSRARLKGLSICVHRADLLAVLKDKLPAACVRVGHEVESFHEGASGITACFANGAALECDALVGADGSRSRVRELLLGDGEPRYRGYHAWRGVALCGHPDHDRSGAVEFWGRGQRFGMEAMTAGRTFWYATRNAPRGALGVPAGRKAEVAEAFRDWPRPVVELIEATPQGTLLKHDIEDRPVLRRFGRGRVTLLGDAAHLTTPNLGQGACLALEDAVVLRDCLASGGEIEPAFRRYEARRYRRVRYIVKESRRIGWVGQIEGRLAGAVRNLMLRALPESYGQWQHQRYFSLGL